MSDAEKKAALTRVKEGIERLIQSNLADPGIAARSEEYRAGYADGVREALTEISIIRIERA